MLEWILSNVSEHADDIIAAKKELGHEIPDHIINPPKVGKDVQFYWKAFVDLSTTRSQAQAPIPWDAIELYIRANKIAFSTTFENIIRNVDHWLLNYWAKKAEG